MEFYNRNIPYRSTGIPAGTSKNDPLMGESSMLLTVAQVLEHFGIPKTTLYRKMEIGEISFQKQGKKRLIDPAEVERAFPQWNKREVPSEHNGTYDGNSDLVKSLRDQIRILELFCLRWNVTIASF